MRTPLTLVLLGAFLALPGPARGDDAPLLPNPGALAEAYLSRSAAAQALDAAVRSGELSPHEARMQRYFASFEPDAVEPRFDGLRDGDPGCASELLAELRMHWDEAPAADRHRVELKTSPLYRAWLAEGGLSWLEGDVDAEQSLERSTCFAPETANPNLGPYARQDSSEHFIVHWNEEDSVTGSRIADLLEWLEASWTFQVRDREFYQPWGMSTNEMLVVVEDLNSPGLGAYATMYNCFGTPANLMTYIVVNTWSFEDAEWLQSTAPHEFFHGIQPVYGIQEFWTGESPNRWLIEASATYMQRIVYPWLYRVEVQQAFRWALEPHRSLETADDSGLQYGLVIFLLSLEESTGTNEWHQALWNQINDRSGYDLRDEFDQVLAPYDTDFLTEWRRFILRGATGMEVNRYLYSPIRLEEQTQGQVDDRIVGRWDGRDLPLDEAVNSASGLDRPEYLGTNYVVFDGDRFEENEGAVITFRGDADKGGLEIEWVVELAAVYNDSVRATYSMPLTTARDEQGLATDALGSVLVNELGEDFDYVVMAVSPVTDFGDGDISWSYTAASAESTGPGGFVPVPEALVEEGAACAGCAASHSPGAAGASWLGLGMMGLLARRRRKGER